MITVRPVRAYVRTPDGPVHTERTVTATDDGSLATSLSVHGVGWVDEVVFELDIPEGATVHVHRWWAHLGLQRCTVAFIRHADGTSGTFAAITNPMGEAEVVTSRRALRLSYRPAAAVPTGTFVSDELVTGDFVAEGVPLERRSLVGRDRTAGAPAEYASHTGDPGPLDRGEVRAVRAAVAARVPWEPARCRVSHWDWAANLYRLHLGADERAIPALTRDAQLAADCGVELHLLSPNLGDGTSDGLASDLGPCLPLMWLGRGERVARGDADADVLPPQMQVVLDAVKANGLRPVSYSNPQAPWGSPDPAWVAKQRPGDVEYWACMAVTEVQDAAIDAYRSFAAANHLGGYSLDFVFWLPCWDNDHGHAPGPDSLHAQYAGYRRILEALWADGFERENATGGPWVEGLIGSQHVMPWVMKHMTHPHPVLTDNQPQWLPAWPDLSLHRVAAHQQRRAAWWMRNLAFMPSYKIPAQVSHQQVRRHYLDDEHGWDFEGSRFNLLSGIMSAPSTIVIGYLPSWDEAEWQSVRDVDAPFFAEWLAFARLHEQVLSRIDDLFDDPRPGAVDGTWARDDDGRGFVFLANPDADPLSAVVPIEDGWVLRERYPERGRLWEAEVTVDGHTVAVFDLLPWNDIELPALVGVAGTVDASGAVVIARGPVSTVVPGVVVGVDDSRTQLEVAFAADDLPPGLVADHWTPGLELPSLLRSQTPPFVLDDEERRAPWLDRSRLRFWFDVIDPRAATCSLRIDGVDVPVVAAYVGIWPDVADAGSGQMGNNLMAWYADVTDRLDFVEEAGTLEEAWHVECSVTGVPAEAFRGLRVAHLPRRMTDRFLVG